MRIPRIRAPKHRWHALVAAVFLVILGFGSIMMAHDWQQAELLDETGIQVTGIVSRVAPPSGNRNGGGLIYYDIAYPAADHRYTVTKSTSRYPPPRKGEQVCLEAARSQPRLTRSCGERYPNGDSGFPTLVLVTVAATIGLLFVTGRWITKRREHLAVPSAPAGAAADISR
ncbi:hypothetical protein AB0M19_13420 [Streptomyces sp. NPDC051920]|uniref:hypothetical protein n=1 Tax=Streptomyces sp. NPDC051920 TaxID=3155523 RepID=UPI003442B13C